MAKTSKQHEWSYEMKRREFLQGVSTGSIFINLGLELRAQEEKNTAEESIIFIWLGGGCSSAESFNHPLYTDIPDEYKGINGFVRDPKTGITTGTDFGALLDVSDKISVIRSLTHLDSAHEQATFFQLSSFQATDRTSSPITKYPSNGAIVSNYYGTNNISTHLPTFVALDHIAGDSSSWLGSQYSPFSPSNKDNLIPKDLELRYKQRLEMVNSINKSGNRNSDLEQGIVQFQKEAFSLIFGKSKDVFEISNEPEKTRESYGKGFGEKLLLARRLAENGSRFISIVDGGYDLHTDISQGMKNKEYVAQSIKTLIQDIYNRSLNKKILVVVTTEFNRTSLTLNSGSTTIGRNHHPYNIPLLFSGGNFQHGRTIGETDKRGYIPEGMVYSPKDLQRTIFDHLKMDLYHKVTDSNGRPHPIHDTEGKSSRNILSMV